MGDNMILCSVCKKEISEHGSACPYCGQPIYHDKTEEVKTPKKKKIIAVLIIWTFIHLVLLITSLQSNEYKYKPERIWIGPDLSYISEGYIYWNLEKYDYSEFFIYAGGAWLMYILYNYLKDTPEQRGTK